MYNMFLLPVFSFLLHAFFLLSDSFIDNRVSFDVFLVSPEVGQLYLGQQKMKKLDKRQKSKK